MKSQADNRNGEPLRVVVTVRHSLVEVAVLPPGVEVEVRDYDVGVRLADGQGTIIPLTCVYRARAGKVEHERLL